MKQEKYLRVTGAWTIAAIAAAIPFMVSCSAGGGADGKSAEATEVASSSAALTTRVVPDRWIVVLKKGVAQLGITGKGVTDIASAMNSQYGGTVVRTYQYALEATSIHPERCKYLSHDGRQLRHPTTNSRPASVRECLPVRTSESCCQI